MTGEPKSSTQAASVAASGKTRRIAPDVWAAAAMAGDREGRSAAGQVNHWARVEQSIALHQSASRRRIQAVLTGTLPMSVLRSDERTIVNAELDASVTEQALTTSLGTAASADGVTTVAVDDDGRLCEYRPDGTSTVLGLPPVVAAR